ncbi:hypothetical protein [Oleiagrimonas sp. C23AA]|uniref:hypothetical protein n=1 Tax=Oleiagrimonas sp. C23AA TaxID=2719047 RepID=UPI00141DB402|nr:hypothetical protein [Oleiagrimonas sp. C23AA]NII09705.1 hypothetical protein [Oleiagrimonas sp. C23AA]
MSGHDQVDWNQAPEQAKAWAVDSQGQAHWLHWDARHDHFDDGAWVQPGLTNNVQYAKTPAQLFGWDPNHAWRESLTLRP